ncbi:MAG: CapA family protein [Treponema sp.]|jgi:poly-gamma-glutamate synthesis protein (capsule biosynthesis protein)|nr:CapA family protein [Treponema sp.]
MIRCKLPCVFLLFFLFAGCAQNAVSDSSSSPSSSSPHSSNSPEVPSESGDSGAKVTRIKMIAAGDNLIHDIIYLAARDENMAYNFDSCYEHIKPIVEGADIAFVNQETVMGGGEFKPSGYPSFNTPQEAGAALVKAGFDVVNQASNHSMDAGEGAVQGTINFWKQHSGVTMLGFFETQAERDAFRIVEKNGIKVGFLSYTYGLNGYRLPRDKPYLVALIDKPLMEKEIAALRPRCDLLVVSMHWGSEFRHDTSAEQKDLSSFLAEQKVDLVIGHHPHVTQGVEIIPRSGGGSLVVYYSLGDLLSHTQSDWTPDTITGALAYIVIKKTVPQKGESVTGIETAAVIPTVCHYRKGRRPPFAVHPLWNYTDELAALHYKDNMTVKYLDDAARAVFGARVLSQKTYESLKAK